ncbi:MAG: AMP phosphorylase [Candidatus Brockarchaeota archaeon]|nr:AMP phosphorylase [Candidatus Brockarchaeota archaeon]
MLLKVRILDYVDRLPTALLNPGTASSLGAIDGSRVRCEFGGSSRTAFVATSPSVPKNRVGLDKKSANALNVSEGGSIEVSYCSPPDSVSYIRKKLKGQPLAREEIMAITRDVVEGVLSDAEICGFVLGQYLRGMSMDEIEHLTNSIVETGSKIEFERPVYDKHSIGGVPGNKVTLVIVPIVAAAGLLIPKTSSRAITSPSGTADTMSVLANVEFTPEEFKSIASKVGGTIAWGGKLGLAPADDIFIRRCEHPLGIDPLSQMIASVMAKKVAVGTNYLVLDIPTGRGSKVERTEDARALASNFMEIGRRVGINVVCGITYGSQPVGHAVGPALEAREALQCLEGKGPISLREKSTALAGVLLEMSGVATSGSGQSVAKSILDSGRALKKMKEIIEAQGGDPRIRSRDVTVGSHVVSLQSPCDGYISEVDNNAINEVAKAAGAPNDKGAGVLLHGKRGYVVKKGQPILDIYAEHAPKLSDAYAIAQRSKPITVEGMLLHLIPDTV